MVESKRNLWIGLGALGALVAAALVYNYVSGDDDDDATPQVSATELMADLEKKDLLNVKRNDHGLEPSYFLRLLQFIGETNKARTAPNRAKSAAKRRVHYEKGEWAEYEEIVKQAFTEEDFSAQNLMGEVLEACGINQMEFQSLHGTLVQNPQTAEAVMAAQQGKYAPPDLKKKPTLSKQKTMEVFKVTQEASASMMETLKKLETQPGDDQEKMMLFMVEQIKVQDKVFFQTGVENEDFEESLMIFMRTDPSVQKEMQTYMLKMQMEAQKQMMGK